jgi:outer membrane immunogenic protein
MKRLLLASLSLVAIAAAMPQAMAADLGVRQPMPVKAPAYMAPYYNWTGFYIGINGGYGFGNSNWSSVGQSFDTNGGLVGGTIGYNWQVGQAVLGLEGDGDWTDIKGSTTTSTLGTIQTQNDWLSTARARLGYAGDRWMPYVTGGAAFGDIKASLPNFNGTDTTKAGWTAGAGLEFAISGPWTAKLEYLYVDLGNANCSSCGPVSPDNVSLKSNIVRAGVNYRF